MPALAYEHAEDLTPARPVNLLHHDRWDCYPLPPEAQQRLAAGQLAIDELAAAMERTRAARDVCGIRAVGTRCTRLVHPVWEKHEDPDGHTWFPGEAPR